MLIQAGVFWNAIFKEPMTPYFDVKISSVDGKVLCGPGGAKLQPHRKIQKRDRFDLVIVPSEGMRVDPSTPSFRKRVQYLNHMYEKGATIASVCTGAFLVAATGLLDGKVATTHWALAGEFTRLYPNVDLDTDLMIADNHRIVTAGGVSADQDLCMHLIDRLCGHEVALQTARCTLVSVASRQQQSFKTFVVEKNHGDREILACQYFIEQHLSDELTVNGLSQRFAMGTRTLNRRFKQATGFSVINYIQRLRVEKARHILEREYVAFEEVAHQLGYDNVSFFRRLFKQQVGLSPKEYRKAYYRESEPPSDK